MNNDIPFISVYTKLEFELSELLLVQDEPDPRYVFTYLSSSNILKITELDDGNVVC
jgi:hypothetical protein